MEAVAQAVTQQQPAAAARKREAVAVDGMLGLAEHRRLDFVLDVPEGHTPEDLLQLSYWAHVAQRLEQHARIEARAETGEWIADLLVVQCGRNWAATKMLALHDLTEQASASPDQAARAPQYIVKWRGGVRKWGVVRISDNALISEGHATQRAADAALAQYENMVATT